MGKGVRVAKVEKDYATNPRLVYDPTHPDAIKTGPRKGYVEFPNVNIVNEMVDMISRFALLRGELRCHQRHEGHVPQGPRDREMSE